MKLICLSSMPAFFFFFWTCISSISSFSLSSFVIQLLLFVEKLLNASLIDPVLLVFLYRSPLYYHLKFAFLVWLQFPSSGVSLNYWFFFFPYMERTGGKRMHIINGFDLCIMCLSSFHISFYTILFHLCWLFIISC